jgi:hypothetical protein
MTLNSISELTRINLRWNNLHKLLNIDCYKVTIFKFFPKNFNFFLTTKNLNFFQHTKTLNVKIFFMKIWHKIFNPKKMNIISFLKTLLRYFTLCTFIKHTIIHFLFNLLTIWQKTYFYKIFIIDICIISWWRITIYKTLKRILNFFSMLKLFINKLFILTTLDVPVRGHDCDTGSQKWILNIDCQYFDTSPCFVLLDAVLTLQTAPAHLVNNIHGRRLLH